MSISMPISMSMSMSSDSNLRHEQNNDENISINENNNNEDENNNSNNNNTNNNNDDEDTETTENNKIESNPNNNFFNSESNKSQTEIDEVPEPGSEPFKDYIKSIVERNQFITQPPDPKKIQFTANNANTNNNNNNVNIGIKRKHSVVENENLNLSIKKCSRCRMKRSNESEVELNKYQTCSQCRNRRKVKERRPRTPMKLPNLSDDWQKFMEKISLNNVIDLYQHNYRAYTNEIEFPRYKSDQLNNLLIQEIGEKVIEKYIQPIQDLTGFKLAVRDHHNPSLFDPNRAKKITWMYICSQDKLRKRKSRSENKRQVLNRLKTEECDSKITLSYDIVNGIVQISYNHKHHKPMGYKNVYENGASDQQIDLNIENANLNHNASGSGHENDIKNNDQLGNNNSQNEVNDQEDVVAAAAAAAAAVAVAVNEQRNNTNDKGTEKNVFEEIPDQNNQFSEINMPITEGTEVEVEVHDSIDNSVDDASEKDQTAAAVAEITKLIKQAEHRRQLETNDLMEIANRARGELEKDQNKDGAHYLINQSLLEQVRREGQEMDEVNDDEDDDVPIDHELLRESEN